MRLVSSKYMEWQGQFTIIDSDCTSYKLAMCSTKIEVVLKRLCFLVMVHFSVVQFGPYLVFCWTSI